MFCVVMATGTARGRQSVRISRTKYSAATPRTTRRPCYVPRTSELSLSVWREPELWVCSLYTDCKAFLIGSLKKYNTMLKTLSKKYSNNVSGLFFIFSYTYKIIYDIRNFNVCKFMIPFLSCSKISTKFLMHWY